MTTATERPYAAPREGLIARHPLVSFFIIAYAGSWLLALPYVRFADGTGLLPFSWPIPFIVAAAIVPFAGPFLAGFIMAGVTGGRAGIGRWLRKIVLWRVGLGCTCSPSSAPPRSWCSARSSCRGSWHRIKRLLFRWC
jgi:uncharacterized protein